MIPCSYSAVTEGASSSAITASSEAGSGTIGSGSTTENGGAAESAVITGSSYNDGSCAIQITQYRAYDTDLYVDDLTLTGAKTLKTALSNNTYGKNVTAATSEIAADGSFFIVREGDVTAEFMQKLGVQTAYNLDGGGSSTMVFNGAVVNCPTSDGRRIQERKVSDIVFIG